MLLGSLSKFSYKKWSNANALLVISENYYFEESYDNDQKLTKILNDLWESKVKENNTQAVQKKLDDLKSCVSTVLESSPAKLIKEKNINKVNNIHVYVIRFYRYNNVLLLASQINCKNTFGNLLDGRYWQNKKRDKENTAPPTKEKRPKKITAKDFKSLKFCEKVELLVQTW